MPTDRLHETLAQEIHAVDARGASKRREPVITGVLPAQDGFGPRYLLAGEGSQPFLKMNSNNYLGMALRAEPSASDGLTINAGGGLREMRSSAASTPESSRVMKRPVCNRSRTSVVFPACLGPMTFTTRAARRAVSTSVRR